MTAFSAQPSWVPNDLIDEDADNQASAPPSHFCSTDRAPHWLMPNFGGPPTGLSMATSTTSTDGASVASSGMTMSARDRHDQSASFNGWGSSAASVASSGMTASTRGPAWEDGTSVASSGLTASARGPQIRPQRQPVSFNAWGPSGEYARMVKNPTVVSGSTRTQPAFRPQPNLGRKGWARGVSNFLLRAQKG